MKRRLIFLLTFLTIAVTAVGCNSKTTSQVESQTETEAETKIVDPIDFQGAWFNFFQTTDNVVLNLPDTPSDYFKIIELNIFKNHHNDLNKLRVIYTEYDRNFKKIWTSPEYTYEESAGPVGYAISFDEAKYVSLFFYTSDGSRLYSDYIGATFTAN